MASRSQRSLRILYVNKVVCNLLSSAFAWPLLAFCTLSPFAPLVATTATLAFTLLFAHACLCLQVLLCPLLPLCLFAQLRLAFHVVSDTHVVTPDIQRVDEPAAAALEAASTSTEDFSMRNQQRVYLR